MSTVRVLEVQQGIWIDEAWLQSAGLGTRLQVILQNGEIRIVAAPTNSASLIPSEQAWRIFRALGKQARAGSLPDASVKHDEYLYRKIP